jgi:hypothetical protein
VQCDKEEQLYVLSPFASENLPPLAQIRTNIFAKGRHHWSIIIDLFLVVQALKCCGRLKALSITLSKENTHSKEKQNLIIFHCLLVWMFKFKLFEFWKTYG